MFRHPYLFVILLFVPVLAIFVSCDDSVVRADTQTVNAVIRIEGLSNSKHIEADVSSVSGAFYQITGTGPSNSTINRTVTASESSVQVFSNLARGNWTFEVSLCTSTGKSILRGQANTALENTSNDVTVELTEVDGKGSLIVTASVSGLTFALSDLSVDCTLTDKDGNETEKTIDIASSGSGSASFTNLDSGYYNLTLVLRDIDLCKVGGASETVRIISSLQSYGSVVIPYTGKTAGTNNENDNSPVQMNMTVNRAFKDSVTFTVSRSGSRLAPVFDADLSSISFSSLSYQWYENGEAIIGANNASYMLKRTSGRWRYDLVITFTDGARTSSGINIQF